MSSSGSAVAGNARLNDLYLLKLRKLEEQKILSDRMNGLVAQQTASSNQCRKNLQAAIAVSKRPGYFEYYTPPPEIKDMEDQKVLNGLARAIQKTHRELEQINSEIDAASETKNAPAMKDMPLTTLNQWFDVFGKPKNAAEREMISSFQPSPKIYGGTDHHRSFKSSSSIMHKGRITR